MNEFADIVAKFQAMTSDGKITLTEAFQFVMQAAQDVVRLTQSLPTDGAEKKAVAMEALGKFIDQVITPLQITGIPVVEGIFDRLVKSVFLSAADAAIEAAVGLFKQIGWPQPKELPEG